MKETPEHSTQGFYDRLSRVYDVIAESSEHEAREVGLDLLDILSGETVLEIGFGTGHALVALAEAVAPDGRVHGIELSRGMRDIAAGRVEDSPHKDRVAPLLLGDARELPFDDDEFDAVFLSFTLELFEDGDIQTVLGEIRRTLKRGGRLGVVSMLEKDDHHAIVDLYRWLHRHFPHIADCRPIDLDAYLENAGFEVMSREEMSIWKLPVAAVAAVSKS